MYLPFQPKLYKIMQGCSTSGYHVSSKASHIQNALVLEACFARRFPLL